MAKKKTARRKKKATTRKAPAKAAPVDVRVATGKALNVKGADIAIKTGLTEGKTYLIKVTPKRGRPVLISVHL